MPVHLTEEEQRTDIQDPGKSYSKEVPSNGPKVPVALHRAVTRAKWGWIGGTAAD